MAAQATHTAPQEIAIKPLIQAHHKGGIKAVAAQVAVAVNKIKYIRIGQEIIISTM